MRKELPEEPGMITSCLMFSPWKFLNSRKLSTTIHPDWSYSWAYGFLASSLWISPHQKHPPDSFHTHLPSNGMVRSFSMFLACQFRCSQNQGIIGQLCQRRLLPKNSGVGTLAPLELTLPHLQTDLMNIISYIYIWVTDTIWYMAKGHP